MQTEGKIRLFQITATVSEYYAVMMSDYENLINTAKNEVESKKEKKIIGKFNYKYS